MATKETKTMCTTCHSRCGVIVYSDPETNEILKITGNPDNPKSRGTCCGAGMSEREIHNNLDGRILYPMKRVDWEPGGVPELVNAQNRGKSEFERISWDEALDILEAECKRISAEYGPTAIITGQGTGRTTNHWHIRLNSSLGLEGWSLTPTHVCLMPHILPNAFTLGVYNGGSPDLMNTQCLVLWGQNPALERSWAHLVYDKQAQGMPLIVIDVRFQDMSKHADVAIQPRPGTDGALAMAFIHEVIENGWYDKDWIDKWTYGFDELAERVKDWTPERAAEICQVNTEDIRKAAMLMGTHGPTGMMIGLGPGCMHTNAIQTGRAIACLQGLLGWLDKKGGIAVPLAFDVMLDPKITLWDETLDPLRAENFTFGGEEHPLYKVFGRSNDPDSVFKAIITGEPRPIKAFIAIANDPILCYENANQTYEAMTSPNLDFICVKDFYMSPTSQLADLLLPSADWSERYTYDEELDGAILHTFDRAVEPPGECKDDWWFFLQWGKRIKPEDWPWEDEKEMVLWRLKEFYGYDMDWEEFQSKPFRMAEKDAEQTGEVVYEKYAKGMIRPDGQPGVNTPTGRIEFYSNQLAAFGYDPLPVYVEPAESPISTPELAEEYPLILVTGIRVYSFFHSAWTNIPSQRKLYPDPYVLVHPNDAQKYGITDGEWITISSRVGKIISKAHVTREIKEGVIGALRPGWRDECKELGLPGYGWDKANPNMLVPSDPAEDGYGCTPMRSSLCKIEPGRCDF